ncbi:MAG: hypothetical protein IT287_04390 [Bdellovibrionaceae bacterium]|nr:hypothetical protein [Pseudobdellovibrionaceae bacterium]
MEAYNKLIVHRVVVGLFFIVSMVFNTVTQAASAEYKCTSKCTFCVTMGKKIVCSEKYAEDTEQFEKGRQLKKFVNEGLINPDESLKQGFTLDSFNQKYFNCELMIKKAEQIQDAAQKMCVAKTVRYEKTVITKRSPANTPVKVKAKPKKTK